MPIPDITLRGFGWVPDRPDFRDLSALKMPGLYRGAVPSSRDLRRSKRMPPIWDQGDLGSCVAHAVGAALEYTLREFRSLPDFTPSRLAIYYDARALQGWQNEDTGCYLRDAFKVVAHRGFAPEDEWPYDPRRFTTAPPGRYYDLALHHKAVAYGRVAQDKDSIRRVLASADPIAFGMTVFSSFLSDAVRTTGVVPLPKAEEHDNGGHAVLMVGYTKTRVIVRNSWGTDWGNKGYFYLPWNFILHPGLARDFWRVTTVECTPAEQST